MLWCGVLVALCEVENGFARNTVAVNLSNIVESGTSGTNKRPIVKGTGRKRIFLLFTFETHYLGISFNKILVTFLTKTHKLSI